MEKHDIVNKGKTRSRRLRSDAISSVFVGNCRMKRDEEPPTDEQADSRSLQLNLMGLFKLSRQIYSHFTGKVERGGRTDRPPNDPTCIVSRNARQKEINTPQFFSMVVA